jgi:hypothetical protein
MNAGAIAISTELIIQSDEKMIEKIFDWIEMNVNGQHMYHNADITYIIGESELFESPVLLNDYPVYHLNMDRDSKFSLYKTVSSIKL